jgi:hypothetical protein
VWPAKISRRAVCSHLLDDFWEVTPVRSGGKLVRFFLPDVVRELGDPR